MDLQLRTKRALVTGASRGIGRAVAERLAEEGADIALLARDATALAAVAEDLGRFGTRVMVVSADTTDDAAVRSAVASVVEEFGGVDILVNAAAQPAVPGPVPGLADLTDDALRFDMETKVLGYLRCARAVAPHMTARGWGRIVNVSGLNARLTGSLAATLRSVGVAAVTANLAEELGPQGVNVTVVHPGATVTERTPGLIAARAAAAGISRDEAEMAMAAGNRIGRLVTAAEVADVVTFLCSPRSVAVNGDAVAVGGGSRGSVHY
ncbi:SDR family NAD(P)-dependent oxidoreductase [Mycolicibacterium sp. CBMA 226]|uniref:SDR family NAD(P)-dependent oxidoreductase n=1 Tax=Mycolicibacterium sp. CBMA 226 TaxID=2606611 RepID=UPI0012DC382B|nr:SDR family NAD(P)-dependent oxidoreductase [Mycolicibacterium sp. CBMA 226]MUL78991.1 SDR family NAD(P)-dependent oxidoreductase [Mycolicibacterium sp. CBMA 226]QGW61307.1 3-oxoacyl-[acyl-carrier-protein] reductase FabG [Mycolicibacterium sp.]